MVTLIRPDARKHNRRKTSRDIVFQSGALVPEGAEEEKHLTESCGVRVTTVPRTVVDLARELPFIDSVTVADSALRKCSFRKYWYENVMKDCRGWPGLAFTATSAY